MRNAWLESEDSFYLLLMFVGSTFGFTSMFFFLIGSFGSIMSSISTNRWFFRWIYCLFKFIFDFFALYGFLNLQYKHLSIKKSTIVFPYFMCTSFESVHIWIDWWIGKERLVDLKSVSSTRNDRIYIFMKRCGYASLLWRTSRHWIIS